MRYNLIFLLLLFSCSPAKINIDKETKDILGVHNSQRDHHFNKDAKAIADLSSNDFILVDGGTVSMPKREHQFKMFDSYFKAVEFIKWDDTKEPVIRFSKDATIAYVAVQKQVILKGLNRSNVAVTDTSDWAWISIYKKEKTGWKLDAISSTRKQK